MLAVVGFVGVVGCCGRMLGVVGSGVSVVVVGCWLVMALVAVGGCVVLPVVVCRVCNVCGGWQCCIVVIVRVCFGLVDGGRAKVC